jgi:hypothetical protein
MVTNSTVGGKGQTGPGQDPFQLPLPPGAKLFGAGCCLVWPSDPHDAFVEYVQCRGGRARVRVTSAPARSDQPDQPDWRTHFPVPDDADRLFPLGEDKNILLVLGEQPGGLEGTGLVDVGLACAEARRAVEMAIVPSLSDGTRVTLGATGMVYGTGQAPSRITCSPRIRSWPGPCSSTGISTAPRSLSYGARAAAR